MSSPVEVTLEITPRSRFDLIDVRRRVAETCRGFLEEHRRSFYCSYHTTAGYLEQSLCARLQRRPGSVQKFMGAFQRIFPPNADYHHDQLHLREELSDEQRRREPRNADSHLTFMGSGLRSCVAYDNATEVPVYFIELDGVSEHARRTRRTTVVGYDREEQVANLPLELPTSGHPVDSVSLRDPRLGVFEQFESTLKRLGIAKGRVDIALPAHERRAALTVNEYETLLMRHDLAEVLRNPVRFMAERGKHMIQDPRAIPNKTLNYAKYDVVQVMNEMMDALGMSDSAVERLLNRFLAIPAERFLRMKRSVSLLVSDHLEPGRPAIVQGTYQTPILVQWEKASAGRRRLEATFVRFA